MHIAIIGNGISGVTAARFIRKLSDHKITIISAETDHFFSRTALMYVYMGHMRYEDLKPYEDWFWTKNRIDLKRGYVSKINTANKQLELEGQAPLAYDKLIIACGSTPNKFGWPGQDLKKVQGERNQFYKRQIDDVKCRRCDSPIGEVHHNDSGGFGMRLNMDAMKRRKKN